MPGKLVVPGTPGFRGRGESLVNQEEMHSFIPGMFVHFRKTEERIKGEDPFEDPLLANSNEAVQSGAFT
jgi:hypothetical protein